MQRETPGSYLLPIKPLPGSAQTDEYTIRSDREDVGSTTCESDAPLTRDLSKEQKFDWFFFARGKFQSFQNGNNRYAHDNISYEQENNVYCCSIQ